ncbi:DUF1071 domain-containing protein [Subdoligranulum sp. DSM 109015]|uniref:DUF1071 domain-containing protein n=1 Tax=Gemmiger gallinarum TaxID=2779354 RepID=A0ABR9R2K3_9FIRM|nr:DUF1071 domain-containing protein [Gemmiger gallinarum]MBE5037305.1 DUF1071 domain-containing protein [Gemmiger gallinarum]
METSNNVFNELFAVNVNGHTEKKKSGNTELTYLSWPFAWAEVKRRYPDASYKVWRDGNGLPYVFDDNTGYMVSTSVTICGVTHEMWLPVMDGANKAMLSEEYSYLVKNPNFRYATKGNDGVYRDKFGNEQKPYNEKRVDRATMFDVNKAIMRCLVKNLAMFGLGLYIYAGEDLPVTDQPEQNGDNEPEKDPKDKKNQEAAEKLAARSMCQSVVKAYCQKNNADETSAWGIIANTIGKASKDFTKEDWEAARKIAEGWK